MAIGRHFLAVLLGAGVMFGAASVARTAAADGACDGKATPCPLQSWMKKNLGAPLAAKDAAALAVGYDKLAKMGPPGAPYGNWKELAEKGAKAAKANDVDGAKKVCKECHDATKDAYKANLRNRPVN